MSEGKVEWMLTQTQQILLARVDQEFMAQRHELLSLMAQELGVGNTRVTFERDRFVAAPALAVVEADQEAEAVPV